MKKITYLIPIVLSLLLFLPPPLDAQSSNANNPFENFTTLDLPPITITDLTVNEIEIASGWQYTSLHCDYDLDDWKAGELLISDQLYCGGERSLEANVFEKLAIDYDDQTRSMIVSWSMCDEFEEDVEKFELLRISENGPIHIETIDLTLDMSENISNEYYMKLFNVDSGGWTFRVQAQMRGGGHLFNSHLISTVIDPPKDYKIYDFFTGQYLGTYSDWDEVIQSCNFRNRVLVINGDKCFIKSI